MPKVHKLDRAFVCDRHLFLSIIAVSPTSWRYLQSGLLVVLLYLYVGASCTVLISRFDLFFFFLLEQQVRRTRLLNKSIPCRILKPRL